MPTLIVGDERIARQVLQEILESFLAVRVLTEAEDGLGLAALYRPPDCGVKLEHLYEYFRTVH